MKTKWKVIGSILGTIILGAIGSGLWELCIKNLFIFFGELILNLLVKMKTNILTDIYTEVSKGNINQVLIENNSYLSSFLFLIIYLITLNFLSTLLFRIKFNEILCIIDKDYKVTSESYKTILFDKLPAKNFIKKIPTIYLIELTFLLGFCMFFLSTYKTAKIKYINTAIEEYNYLNVNIQPFVSDKYIKNINSRFSQIQNKIDYELLIKEMETVANKNNVKKREFKTL